MKTTLLLFFLLMASQSLVNSQNENTKAATQSSTTARILGSIPDGTPPLPEPPKPKFIVPAKDILETKTHQQGGRTVTVRKITPIDLPPSPVTPPVDLSDPAIQERIAEFREEHPGHTFLAVGATAYHFADAPPRSHVRIW